MPSAALSEGEADDAVTETARAAVARESVLLPPSAVHESVADGPVFHDEAAMRARGQSDLPDDVSAEVASPAGPDTTTPSEADDPARPKRSGWWRRARATFVGE
jgi:hypothetical protein